MTAVGQVVRIMTIEIDGYTGTPDAVECATTSATLTPTSNVVTTQTACADGTKTDAAPATWTFDLQLNADESTTALTTWLVEHEGDLVAVEWTPNANKPDFAWSFDATVQAPTLSYPVGQFATGTCSLLVSGKPAAIDPTP